MPTSARQTFTYLRDLFGAHGITPSRRYGQNFLIDLNIHDLIVRSADLNDHDVVLEVGPGAGALTTRMAELASAVLAVEIDPAMAALTLQAAAPRLNIRVLNLDALAGKHKIHPQVIDSLEAGLAMAPDKRLKLVANLPYNVATPLISNLLVHDALRPSLIVVTIQKELADRILAHPRSPHYGALSVIVQALADVELIRVLSPKVFWPSPRVDSAIIKITPDPRKRSAIPDLPWFHFVVRELFLLRRKNLRGVIYSRFRDHWQSKRDVDDLLDSLGLLGEVRAEAMNVPEFLDLACALQARFGPHPPLPDPPAQPDAAEPESDSLPDPL